MSTPIRTVAVIVPTLGARDLSDLRRAIQCQTRPAAELIVVEDRARRGSAWARNRGIEQSSSDLLAFLDDDCIPPPEWLESLTAAVEAHDASVVGGTYDDDDPFLRARRDRQDYPAVAGIDHGGWVGAGGNTAYRRDALDRLLAMDGHYFNEQFRISQDKELAWRARMRGERLVYIPVRVRHTKRSGPWAYLIEQFGRGVGIAGLHCSAKRAATAVAPDRGRLWAGSGRLTLGAWLRIFIIKAAGPFDRRGFQNTGQFLLFWIGEKSQGLGFLWGLAWRPFAQRTEPG